MLRQLKFDFGKLLFQRKYMGIYIVIFLLSSAYSHLLFGKGQSFFETAAKTLSFFRPFCWLIGGYAICEMLSSDYHDKNIKSYLLFSKSRVCYLFSKVSIAYCYAFGLFLCLYVSLLFMSLFHSNGTFPQEPFFISSIVGNFAGILWFVSLASFCIVLTESEALTIGFVFGLLLLFFILETVASIGKFLPTMWGINALLGNQAVSVMRGIIVFSGVAPLFLLWSLRTFHKKDIFC